MVVGFLEEDGKKFVYILAGRHHVIRDAEVVQDGGVYCCFHKVPVVSFVSYSLFLLQVFSFLTLFLKSIAFIQ